MKQPEITVVITAAHEDSSADSRDELNAFRRSQKFCGLFQRRQV